MKTRIILLATLLMASYSIAQTNSNPKNLEPMKTYVIEREIPNAGQLSQEQLQGISRKSNSVIAEMGPQIEWLQSYVAENKVYCIYKAKNKEAITEHGEKGEFPVNSISELSSTISPESGKN